MRRFSIYFILALLGLIRPAGAQEALSAEEQKYLDWANQLWDSLDHQQGKISLPNGAATLNVPKQFYYLNPDDTKKVLVEVWNNPPSSKKLGMLFPADTTPFDEDVWAIEIEYEEDGFVSDEEADTLNYNELLTTMQDAIQNGNAARIEAGYEPLQLLG